MRRSIAVAVALGMLACMSHGATLQFSNWVTAFHPLTGDGTSGPLADNMDVWLVQETGGSAGFDFGIDTVLMTVDMIDQGGSQFYYFGNYGSLADAQTFYVVALNTLDWTTVAPTAYAVTDLGSYSQVGPNNASIDFLGDTGGWTLVPEPGTLALFALGCVALVSARRLRRRK